MALEGEKKRGKTRGKFIVVVFMVVGFGDSPPA
jgi:hypothetical protein